MIPVVPQVLGQPLVGRVALGREESVSLALAGAGRLVELAAASLKGLAAGTRDALPTPIVGPVQAPAARPKLRSRDQVELAALNQSDRGSAYRPAEK
jgi:hypothetical protein